MAETSLVSLITSLKVLCIEQENEIRAALGLSVAEFHCLTALTPGEELSSAAFSRSLGLSPSRTTRIVDTLIERGFLKRTQGPDRRTNAIALSTSGCELHQRIAASLIECERTLLNQLGEKHYCDAQRVLQQLIAVTTVK
jgi:DNA-binding MarR family transcriptional regulator